MLNDRLRNDGTKRCALPSPSLARLLPFFVAALLIAGCGSGDDTNSQGSQTSATAKREAAGTTCPEKSGSKRTVLPVANYLDAPVKLRAYDVDCYDWSGSSTPDRVFNDVVLQPDQKREFVLEAYADESVFSMDFASTATGSIGSVRLLVRPGEGAFVNPGYRWKDVTRTLGCTLMSNGCRLLPLEPTGADSVPLDQIAVEGGVGITYYDGYIQAVSSD